MVQFCYLRLYLDFKKRFWSSAPTHDEDGNELRLKKVGSPFSILNAAPAEITKKELLQLLLPDEICLICSSQLY